MGTGQVPRADPVQVALATLSDNRNAGALFVGPLGSGKTHALLGVVRELGSPSQPSNRLTVVSAGSLRRREVRALLRSMPEVGNRSAASRRVVAVDDLDRWEPTLLTLLADAVDRRSVRVVGTVRSAAVDEVMASFRPALAPLLVDLPPWRSSDLSVYARAALDAPLHPLATAALVRFSGGNPLCLTEMLQQGRLTGHLQRRHEVWSWGPDLTVPPVTYARVWKVLSEVPPVTLDVVATLGAFGDLPLPVMRHVHSLAALQEAEGRGWVVARASRAPVEVALRRPLDGQVAVLATSLLRLRELVVDVVQALAAEGERRSLGPLAAAQMGLLTGLALPDEVRHAAAEGALRYHRLPLAAELARGAVDAATAAVRSAALAEQGRFREAASALEAADPAPPGTSPEEAFPAWAAALRALGGEQGPAGGARAGRGPDVLPALCADAWGGRHLDDVVQRGQSLLDAGLEGPPRVRCLAATTWAALQLARVDEAIKASGAHDVGPGGPGRTTMELLLAFATGVCRAMRGELREAEAVAEILCRAGVEQDWHLAFALGAFLGGRCAIAQARPRLALRRLSESAASLRAAAPLLDRAPLLDSLALAYALAGRPSDPEKFPRSARSTSPTSVPGPGLLTGIAELSRAEALLASGRRHPALEVASHVAATADDKGWILVSLLAWHLLARIRPSAEAVSRVTAVSEQADFALATTYARHATAALTGDRRRLQEVADRYDSLGLRWLAGEAAATALAGADRADLRAPWAVHAKRLLGRIQLEKQFVPPAWWGSAAEQVAPLTPRELEIAEAVVAGESSPRIAARLRLSRRTVENHLQHIYRKVGVSRREDLDIAFGTVVPRAAAKGKRP